MMFSSRASSRFGISENNNGFSARISFAKISRYTTHCTYVQYNTVRSTVAFFENKLETTDVFCCEDT